MSIKKYLQTLDMLKGKTIALVYIFEGEDAPGYKHYDIWKSEVITDWLKAIEEIKCIPYIIDIRTFILKAMNKTLPHIDYVVNLNNGNEILSTLALLPSICSFLSIKIIPNNLVSMLICEHKKLSNTILSFNKIKIPPENIKKGEIGIERPFNLGSSIGVEKKTKYEKKDNKIFQKFIKGIDATIPVLYNPVHGDLDILPAIAYIQNPIDINWFYSNKDKNEFLGIKKEKIELDDSVKREIIEIAKSMFINNYCRIDIRIECKDISQVDNLINNKIDIDSLYFIEINSMPTIYNDVNFTNSISYLSQDDNFFECFNVYRKYIKNSTLTGFVLSSSMISYINS